MSSNTSNFTGISRYVASAILGTILLIGNTAAPSPEFKVVRQTPSPAADATKNIQVWAQSGAQVGAVRVNGAISLSGAVKTIGNLSGNTLNVDSTTRLGSGVIIKRTTDIGWSVQASANQACNTTCVNACVFGEDTSVLGSFVSCSDATADRCLCAGGS